MTTYETNITNNVYGDTFSDISKELSSSTSSFVDEAKRISFVERKNSPFKQNKRNSMISRFGGKKDDKEKEEKEKHHSEGRSLDKDNKRSSTIVSDHLRPTPRTSSNSEVPKNRRSFVFFSDEEKSEPDDTTSKRGKKSRQNSNVEDKKRFSVLGKLKFSKSKNNTWDDSFVEPNETKSSSKILKNPFRSSSPSLKNKPKNINTNTNSNNSNNNTSECDLTKDYVESSQVIIHNDNSIIGTITDEPKSITDDVQSTISSSQPSSVDDQYFTDKHEDDSTATTPITPKAIFTPNESETTSLADKEDMVYHYDDVINGERRNDGPFINIIEQHSYDYNNRMLRELETLNKSVSDLSDAKDRLEAKVAEQNNQLVKFNSMEQIVQQTADLSRQMTDMVKRLESKVAPKEDSNGLNMFQDTIRRLENKIDRQNDELVHLKSIVGQLTGENTQLLLARGDISHQNVVIVQEEERALIQSNQSQSPIYSRRTLVSSLVVSPLCSTITASASIATSVLYAVYVRPVVGLVSVLRASR